jgi:hypothetical protein
MLKASYHPRWRATIDGHPVKVAMLAPSFVGVPVSAGSHLVVFRYHPISYYPALFALGLLTLIALIVAPRLWKRRSRPRATTPTRRDRSVDRERKAQRKPKPEPKATPKRRTLFEEQ